MMTQTTPTIHYGIDYNRFKGECNHTLRELSEYAAHDYKVFLGIPTRYAMEYTGTNFYHDHSLVYENRTGRPVYIRHYNGIVQRIDPMVGNWEGQFLDIFENVDTDAMLIQDTDAYGNELESMYTQLRDRNCKDDISKMGTQMVREPSNRNWGLCRRIEKRVIANSDSGIVIEGLPIMIFDTEEEARKSSFIGNTAGPSSGLSLDKVGLEITVISPTNRYSSFYTPYMDGIKKIRVVRRPSRSDGTVEISRTDADGHITTTRHTIAELTEGTGVEGFRLYETEQEAHIDSRKPLGTDSKIKLEREKQEFAIELEKMRRDYSIKRKKAEDGCKEDLNNLKSQYASLLERAKRQHEEDMDELRAERKAQEKLWAAEKAKQKEEERWKTAKDKTSIFSRITDAAAAFIGLIVKVFSMAF